MRREEAVLTVQIGVRMSKEITNSWFVYVTLSLKISDLQCPALSLKNGRIKLRQQGRMAYFRCRKKFKRVGERLSICLKTGAWSQPTPVCVGKCQSEG